MTAPALEICSVLQSLISSFCQRLWVRLRDKWYRLTFLVSFNNGRFKFFQHVPICNFHIKKRWRWCGRGVSVSSCDPMGRSMFLMISLVKTSCMFFEISFASTIFVSSHAFSDCCFLMFLKTSVFNRLLCKTLYLTI